MLTKNIVMSRKLKLLSVIIFVVVIFFVFVYASAFIERNKILSRNDFSSISDYSLAKDISQQGSIIERKSFIGNITRLLGVSDRAKSTLFLDWIKAFESKHIERLLSEKNYTDAKSFLNETQNGLKDTSIFLAFSNYEKKYFQELVEDNITTNLNWSYDINEIYVPAEHETKFHQDFFGDWYSVTRKSGGDYNYSDYDGAYLSLKIINNFYAIDIFGNITVTAKESRGEGIAGASESFFDMIGTVVAVAITGNTEWALKSIWDKSTQTTVKNIQVKPQETIYHSGKVPLQHNKFEEGYTPKISFQLWTANL